MCYDAFMQSSNLRRVQLDSSLRALSTQIQPRPKSGWIAEIRKALVMTSAQLAKKLGIDQSTLSRLEKSEVKNTITLESLHRAANALGCELHYVFIPREPLEKTWLDRAEQKLENEDKRLQHTLALEGQSDYDSQLRKDVRTVVLAYELGSKIWDEE